MIQVIEDKIDDIISLCKQHQVVGISVFGSAARNSMQETSDIDLLVQFSETIELLDYADNYFDLKDKLELLLGREIDLVSIKSLKNMVLIEEINNSKIDLYAA